MAPPPDDHSQPQEERRAGGLGYVLRETLSQAYDYIFLLIAGSLLFGLSLAIPTFVLSLLVGTRLVVPASCLVAAVSVGPVWVALYGLSQAVAERELPGLGHLFATLRRFYWRSIWLSLVEVFILGGSLLAAWFYQANFDHWLIESLSLLWIYLAVFWMMMGLYVPAFLVRDDSSIWSALRKGALLTLAHPGYTFLVLLQIAFVALVIVVPILSRIDALLGLSFLLFFLFFPGFTALLATNAMNDRLRAYAEPEADKGDVEPGEKGGV
jgi:uncharacterized membrane protein YesL